MFADVIFRREKNDDRKYAVRRPAVVMFVKKNNQAGTKLREQAQKQKMPLDDVELRSIK